MRSDSMLHLLIIGPKRLRVRVANVLRGTPGWRLLRACYRACSLLWNNAVVRSVTDSVRRQLYAANPRASLPPPLDQAYRKELVRVARRYVLHTEQFKDSVHVFAHNNEGQYRVLGHRLVKAVSYPFNPPGQQMTFQVFEIGKH